MLSSQLTWDEEKRNLISQAFARFNTLGFWVNRKTILYRNVPPGFQVSPRYLLDKISENLEKDHYDKLDVIQSIVQTCDNMQRLGFNAETISDLLAYYEKFCLSGTAGSLHDRVREITAISYHAKDMLDLQTRLEKLELSQKLHDEAVRPATNGKWIRSKYITLDKFF